MKKIFLLSIPVLLAITILSCKKSDAPAQTYPAGQGSITGNGGAAFSVSNTATIFSKTADTLVMQANISQATNAAKSFVIGMVVKSIGTISFNNFAGNINGDFTSGAIAYYTYVTTNSGGTIIAHEYFVKSGSVNVTSFSGSHVQGTYTGIFSDVNNNGDPDITINGNFEGNF